MKKQLNTYRIGVLKDYVPIETFKCKHTKEVEWSHRQTIVLNYGSKFIRRKFDAKTTGNSIFINRVVRLSFYMPLGWPCMGIEKKRPRIGL